MKKIGYLMHYDNFLLLCKCIRKRRQNFLKLATFDTEKDKKNAFSDIPFIFFAS